MNGSSFITQEKGNGECESNSFHFYGVEVNFESTILFWLVTGLFLHRGSDSRPVLFVRYFERNTGSCLLN
jgi:hypothetical protein